MTPNAFRQLALALPGASEAAHMGHPDFRAGGRIFATLTADGARAMIKLRGAEQRALVREDPSVYEPAAGAWGKQGCTMVLLAHADPAVVERALQDAHAAATGATPGRR